MIRGQLTPDLRWLREAVGGAAMAHLMGYWDCARGGVPAGGTMAELSGQGDGGVLNGSAYADPVNGIRCNGSTDYVDLGAASQQWGLRLNTCAFLSWVRWTYADNWVALLGHMYDASGPYTLFNIHLNRTGASAVSAGDIWAFLENDTPLALQPYTRGLALNDGAWHMIVVRIMDASANSAKIYVDGSAAPTSFNAASSPTGNWSAMGGHNQYLGARNYRSTSAERYFPGDIGLGMFFGGHSLTPAAIRAIYDASKWRFR